MSVKQNLIASAISLVLLSSINFSYADETSDAASVAMKQGEIKQEELAKIAQQGFDAVNKIQEARENLFEGMINESSELLDSAAALLKADSTAWDNYTKTPSSTKDIKNKDILKDEQYIAINSTLVLADDFKPTDDQQAKLVEAGKKFKEGDEKGGINEFKLADVALSDKLILLPLHFAQKAVETAQIQFKNKQYYEANLTLKSIVDSLVSDNVVIVEQIQ